MTIDDDSSIYVGGLPYDATEESLRRVFHIYGAVVAVKIINDRGVGGKCYGFVTFKNPRSAIHAIEEMDGRTIDGRVVKVNEVKTRGGRTNYGRESFRRNSDRGLNWDRGRERGSDYDHDRDRYRDRHRDRSRGRDQEREREYENPSDHDRTRSRLVDGDRYQDQDQDPDQDQDRDMEDIEQENRRNPELEWERDQDLNSDQDNEIQRSNNYHKSRVKDEDQLSKLLNGSSNFNDRRGRELSSDSSDDDHEGEIKLNIYEQKREELKKEISQMKEQEDEKKQQILKLQEKTQKLEDALTVAKKLSSHRQMQLTKLHKCFMQVKDYSERLKGCEQDLQSLVDSAMIEVEYGDDVGVRDGILANGNG